MALGGLSVGGLGALWGLLVGDLGVCRWLVGGGLSVEVSRGFYNAFRVGGSAEWWQEEW